MRCCLVTDRLAWMIMGAKANVDMGRWKRLLASFNACGGHRLDRAVSKLLGRAILEDAIATEVVRHSREASCNLDPIEDMSAKFIAEAQAVEAENALKRLTSVDIAGPPRAPLPLLTSDDSSASSPALSSAGRTYIAPTMESLCSVDSEMVKTPGSVSNNDGMLGFRVAKEGQGELCMQASWARMAMEAGDLEGEVALGA